MNKTEAREKASLLKESLKIVNELADFDLEYFEDTGNSDDIRDLMKRAQTLRKSRWWDVPKR